jgi:hypothetical protein
MRTVVYVDGFNLYYGALRGTPFKWLDLYGLFREHVLEPGARSAASCGGLLDSIMFYLVRSCEKVNHNRYCATTWLSR